MSTEQTPLLVVTTSTKLQEALTEILEPEYSCEFAKSIEQAEKILQAKPINATIVDFQAATENNALDELNQLDSSLVHVLVCPRDKREELLATNLSNEAYRVLFAPLSAGQTQLAVQSAAKFGSTKTGSSLANKKKTPNKPVPILAGLGAAAVAVTFFLTRGSEEPETPVQTAQTQATEPLVQLTLAQENAIRDLNTQANNAIELGNLFPPLENNAVNAYFEILKVNNKDKTALDGLQGLAAQALGDLELHLGNGSVDAATQAIAAAQTVASQSIEFAPYVEQALTAQKNNFVASAQAALSEKRVADALTSIETAKAVYADDSQVLAAYDSIFSQKENFDREAEVNNLVSSARTAMLENNLLTPSNRNARYYINSLETLDPENPSLRLLKNELSSALLISSRAETLDNEFTRAKRLLESARSLGADQRLISTELSKIERLESDFRQVEQARIQREQQAREAEQRAQQEQQRLAQEAEEAQRQAELAAQVAPSNTSTPANNTPPAVEAEPEPVVDLNVPVDVRLNQLNVTRRVNPDYPRRLERRGVSGYADIAFTLQKNGSITNVRTISTDPADAEAFGREAVDAVEKWEFDPYLDEDGNARIANSRVRIRFNL